MFNANAFYKMGMVRDTSKDFMDNGRSFKCYMKDDLRVLYSGHYDNYFILIRIPYQNYNFTYEDAKKEDWFKYTTKWFGCSNIDINEFESGLNIIRNGIHDLNEKILKEDIDESILNKAYREEVLSAKSIIKQFKDKFDWIHADQRVRNISINAYYKLLDIVTDDIPDFEKSPIRIKRSLMDMLNHYGYLNTVIHNNIEILKDCLNKSYIGN